MRVLVHLGLNKCASTYIQHALDRARPALAAAGCWYPETDGPPCQYGLSRHYGFGPDEDHIAPVALERLIDEAAARGCARMVLSSEYFSLYRPNAADRFVTALDRAGCRTEFVLFSRDIPGWIVSLFNQYVRTVDGGRYLPDIDAFVAQILRNRAIDVAARVGLWRSLAGRALKHYAIGPDQAEASVLAPFSAFAGTAVPPPDRAAGNIGLGADALFRIGQLRAGPRSAAQDQELDALLAGGAAEIPAPLGYMTISAPVLARLEDEVIAPYRALPVDALPTGEGAVSDPAPAAHCPAPRLARSFAFASDLLPRRIQQRAV